MNTNQITKTEDVLALDGAYDTRHVLNLCDRDVPQSVLDRIEAGCPIETIEEIAGDFPICKYATQITIHGKFPELSTNRIGNYKNLVKNLNGSVGIRWSAIDHDKRTRLFRKCRICKGFGIVENSTNHFLEKFKLINESNAEQVIGQFLADAEKIDRSLFTGNVSVWRGSYLGMQFAVFQVFVRSFHETDFDALARSICGMTEEEMTAAEAAYAEQQRLAKIETERKLAEYREREAARKAEVDAANAQWLIDNPPPFPQIENYTLQVGDVFAVPKVKDSWRRDGKFDHWEFRKVTKSFGRLIASPVDQDGNKTAEFRYVRGREIEKATGTFYVRKVEVKPVPVYVPNAARAASATGVATSAPTIRENTQKGGIELYFDGVPSESVRNDMKRNGFRWSKFSRCWWHTASSEARSYAERLVAAS